MLTARIVDAATGEKVGGRVQIIGTEGAPIAPPDAMWKIGTGEPFFYSNGEFTLNVPRGRVQVTVERGTEYIPWRRTLEFNEPGHVEHVIELERWCDPAADGWHPGNLHLHYKETEDDPDRRIMYDSRIEDLRVTALSYVKRWDLPYASNRYAPGVLKKFTDARHHIQCGEETRHYFGGDHLYGFGHVMLLDLRNVVIPPGRGFLVDAFAAEYPPISYACDDTHQSGRRSHLVSQRPRHRVFGGGDTRQGGRAQPVGRVLGGPGVGRLVRAAQLRYPVACVDRFRLVPVFGQQGIHEDPAGIRVHKLDAGPARRQDVHHERPDPGHRR